MKLNATNFKKVMKRVADKLKNDPHHRLLSWDHAWEHWQTSANDPDGDEIAALHLAFYLASWGMYRGSSDLLYRDFKVLIPGVQFLKEELQSGRFKDFVFSAKSKKEVTSEIQRLANKLKEKLKPKFVRPEKNSAKINVSDTLISKILLVTLECVPAFDTEVKSALRDILKGKYLGGNDAFESKRLGLTIELARSNRKIVKYGQKVLKKVNNKTYPLIKVLDLYLWYHGHDLQR